MKKQRPSVNRRVHLAFGSAILALLMVGAISYRALVISSESDHWVRHTHEVLEHLGNLLSAMQSVESGARGFALTGKESYIESHQAGVLRSEQEITIIHNLTADNAAQQRQIPLLQNLADQKIERGRRLIATRKTSGLTASVDFIRNGRGQQIMANFQNVIKEMQDEEQRLLVLRDADAARRLTQTKTTLFFGTLLGLLITGGAGWTVRRDNSKRECAEDALREEKEQFYALANNISQLAWMADEKGYIFWYNDRWFDYTGTTLDAMAGWGWQKVHHPDHVQRVVDKISQCFQTGEPWEDTFPLRGRDGKYRSFLSRAVPIRDRDGKVLRWFGTNTDISERQAMEEALFTEKERAQVTLDSIGDAVICTDISGNITFLNQVAENMTGWPPHEAIGRPMAHVFNIQDATSRETTPDPMQLALEQDRTMSLPPNCILIRRDGFETPIEDSVSPIHDREGRATGAVIVFRDVSAAQSMALQMAHSAQHDFLTGLPNRMLLNDRVDQAIVLAPRHFKKVAVLFMDLDGFKHINDSLGHSIGDQLLQSVARRLLDCVRVSDTVSRQGGDEFVVLLFEIEQAEDAAITARRILQSVGAVHSIAQHDLHITASIGVSVYPDDGVDSESLVKNADTAMYQAKGNGRSGYRFFKPAMAVRAVERQSIEEDLRQALARNEFALHYQPKVSLTTGEITGAEALLRWTHPTRGSVPPAEFIPVAEDCGLILPIGDWGLREACKQGRIWVDAGLPMIRMAVNVSALQFRDDSFLESVFAALAETGLEPSLLELELTETVLMAHAEVAESILKALKAKGVRVAVDDFGTGYSSLSYLRRFPIDVLKIDQSFVRQITTVPAETTIVTAVISMGRSLNLRVIAEGVETYEELAFLQAHHCDEAQGYYFGRPVAASQFAELLKNGISETVLR